MRRGLFLGNHPDLPSPHFVLRPDVSGTFGPTPACGYPSEEGILALR